jgi:acyl dehydratase
MSPLPFSPRGMYFEEFQVGQRITSPGRTIQSQAANLIHLCG